MGCERGTGIEACFGWSWTGVNWNGCRRIEGIVRAGYRLKKRCGDPASWIRYDMSQPCETMNSKQSGLGEGRGDPGGRSRHGSDSKIRNRNMGSEASRGGGDEEKAKQVGER